MDPFVLTPFQMGFLVILLVAAGFVAGYFICNANWQEWMEQKARDEKRKAAWARYDEEHDRRGSFQPPKVKWPGE